MAAVIPQASYGDVTVTSPGYPEYAARVNIGGSSVLLSEDETKDLAAQLCTLVYEIEETRA